MKLQKSKRINRKNKVCNKHDLIRLPAIFCDVDGVLVKGFENSYSIGHSDEIVKQILLTKKHGKSVPFTLLTNSGFETEQAKAEKLNKIFKLEDICLSSHNVVLCNSVYGSPEIQNEYGDKIVLIDGISEELVNLALSYGLKKVITISELCSLYPDLSPLMVYDFCGRLDLIIETKKRLLSRYNSTEQEFKSKL